MSSIEAYQGLVKIVKTEGGQDTPHKHRKSNSLFIRRVPYNKKIETLPNDTDTNNKYVTKIDLRPKNHMDKPKIKIPYIKTFIQKGNFYYSNNNNMRNLKELVEANVQKLCFEGIFPQKYYLKSPTNIKTTNLLLKIKNRNKSAQK